MGTVSEGTRRLLIVLEHYTSKKYGCPDKGSVELLVEWRDASYAAYTRRAPQRSWTDDAKVIAGYGYTTGAMIGVVFLVHWLGITKVPLVARSIRTQCDRIWSGVRGRY